MEPEVVTFSNLQRESIVIFARFSHQNRHSVGRHERFGCLSNQCVMEIPWMARWSLTAGRQTCLVRFTGPSLGSSRTWGCASGLPQSLKGHGCCQPLSFIDQDLNLLLGFLDSGSYQRY